MYHPPALGRDVPNSITQREPRNAKTTPAIQMAMIHVAFGRSMGTKSGPRWEGAFASLVAAAGESISATPASQSVGLRKTPGFKDRGLRGYREAAGAIAPAFRHSYGCAPIPNRIRS